MSTTKKIIFEKLFLNNKLNHFYKRLLNDYIIKQQNAEIWAKNNNYSYIIISDDWFKNNANKIEYNKYPKLKKYMKQFING